MKLKLLKALAALLVIKADNLTDTQKSELTSLTKQAKEDAGIKDVTSESVSEIIEAHKSEADDFEFKAPSETTDEELKALITAAVEKALKGSGIDNVEIVKSIRAAIKEKGSEALTPDAIEKIVVKHAGGQGIDKEALIAEVKAAVPTDILRAADLDKILDRFAKSVRTQPKAAFPSADPYERDFPIEHRHGNLTVGQKQLLNTCLRHVSDEKKEQMEKAGITIPTSQNDGITAEQLKHAQQRGDYAIKMARQRATYGKALTTGGANSGADLIPTDLSGELMQRMYLESQLANEMVSQEIDMPTNPFEFPLRTTRTTFYKGSEAPGSDPTESTPGTDLITLNAKKLIGYSEYSYEADEDSIVAVLPMLLDNMAQGAADALEDAIINGDTSATQDSDASAGDASTLFNGLRKLAIAGSLTKDLSTGGISVANVSAMRKMLKRWGVKPRDLLLICGPQGYNDFVGLDETLTFDKVGNAAAARILTGEAGSLLGIRLVVSSQIREDLNASGVYDGSTTTKGSFMLVHRPSWILGVKRQMTVEVDVNKKRQINEVIASFRRDFVPHETPSLTLPSVVLGYNYDA
jgi:HK97 family phage major capsid protein